LGLGLGLTSKVRPPGFTAFLGALLRFGCALGMWALTKHNPLHQHHCVSIGNIGGSMMSAWFGKVALVLGVVGVIGAAGCSTQAPKAVTYPYTTQQLMQAAYHWEVLAQDTASKITASKEVTGKRLYVVPASPAYPFAEGFHTLLVNELVNQGVTVVEKPEMAALHVKYDVQLLKHGDRGYIRPHAGMITAGTVGVAALAATESGLSLVPVFVGLDVGAGSITGGEPDTEIIIATQVTDGETIQFSQTNIYYVRESEMAHYKAAPKPIPAREFSTRSQ